MLKRILALFLTSATFSCAGLTESEQSSLHQVLQITDNNLSAVDGAFKSLVEEHQVHTAGVAVINGGKVVWKKQYGTQSEGVLASSETLFNVASLTKPVVAETILRLVEQGKLTLDESVAKYWVDPDLKDDPRLEDLTVRMLLNHTSGFMNWRFFSDDGELTFVNDPGTTFGYSGEGFEYLAKYAENKLGQPFNELVQTTLFDSLEMDDAFITVDSTLHSRIAKPFDKDGKFYGYFCNPYGYCAEEGSFFAAANMVVTVGDYAKFLLSAMSGNGLSKALRQDRDRMQGVQFSGKDIVCDRNEQIPCPTQLGYGLGWSMSHFDGSRLIGHRGTNWKVVSLTYYYPESRDGLVIFFNAPNKAGLAAMVDALELLDPDSPEILGYRLRLARTE